MLLCCVIQGLSYDLGTLLHPEYTGWTVESMIDPAWKGCLYRISVSYKWLERRPTVINWRTKPWIMLQISSIYEPNHNHNSKDQSQMNYGNFYFFRSLYRHYIYIYLYFYYIIFLLRTQSCGRGCSCCCKICSTFFYFYILFKIFYQKPTTL